jgi:hypothetical protein
MSRDPAIAATLITLTALSIGNTASALVPESPASTKTAVIATFEGAAFDMTRGWGAATACNVTDTATICYRTEAAMNKAIAPAPGTGSVAANCSSSLRLYDGTGHTGQVINIATRSTLLSLSGYGFDNKTSSYIVGACSARLYNGIGTSQYGGSTSAGASATSMASGWNNVISSVSLS